MPIEYNISEIDEDLLEFQANLQEIDMERVKSSTLQRVAESMTEMVRQAIVAEDKIQSPARLNSQYNHGPGSSLATKRAWKAEKKGPNTWTVSPKPKVRQRAVILNFGYPGTIRPTNSDYLRFTVNGVPVFRKEVEGPDRTNYWRAALARIQDSGEFERIAEEELQEEIELALG